MIQRPMIIGNKSLKNTHTHKQHTTSWSCQAQHAETQEKSQERIPDATITTADL